MKITSLSESIPRGPRTGVSRFLIYALKDPRTEEFKYIGRSSKGLRRPRDSAKDTIKGNRGVWVKELSSIGLQPKIVILEECSSQEEIVRREIFWISELGGKSSITNMTTGGKDLTPFPTGEDNPSKKPENRKRASDRIKARFNKDQWSKDAKTRWENKEYREKITKASKDRTQSTEFRRKASERFKKYYEEHDSPNSKAIVAIASSGDLLRFRSIAEAARELGANPANIIKVLQGKRSHAKGYKYEYTN